MKKIQRNSNGMAIIIHCTGDGMSECKRCKSLGIYSLCWDSWFYRFDGRRERYCISCIDVLTGGDYEIKK